MARKRTLLTVLLLSAPPTTLATAALARGEHAAAPANAPGEVVAVADVSGEAERLVSAATPPSPVGSPPSPPPDASAPAALLALRDELYRSGRDGGQAQMSRFRPLCDRDGYPLVGNVMNKSVVYHPSEFCSDVRKAAR